MTDLALPPAGLIDDAVRRALAEDLGDAGDITTAATVPAAFANAVAPATPEPTSAALLGIGALLLAARRRRSARS